MTSEQCLLVCPPGPRSSSMFSTTAPAENIAALRLCAPGGFDDCATQLRSLASRHEWRVAFRVTVSRRCPQGFRTAGPPFFVSELAPASQCGFLKLPAGWVGDTHPSPIRMWVFFLSGEMEFEASDGEKRKCVPGTALLLEDTTGDGHKSRVVGDANALLAVVRL